MVKQGVMVRIRCGVLTFFKHVSNTDSLSLLFYTIPGFGGGGGGGGMVVFVYDPENYINNGMTVDIGSGEEGMGETWEDHKGLPGSDGQKYMNGVVV